MQNKLLDPFLKQLHSLDNVRGKDFAYVINQNKRILLKAIEALLKRELKIDSSFISALQEYTEKAQQLAHIFCIKDRAGVPVLKNGSPEFLPKYVTEMAELYFKFKDLKAEMARVEKVNSILYEAESNIKLIKINNSIIPDDITVSEMDCIFDLVEVSQ
jgi:hypothetical protein